MKAKVLKDTMEQDNVGDSWENLASDTAKLSLSADAPDFVPRVTAQEFVPSWLVNKPTATEAEGMQCITVLYSANESQLTSSPIVAVTPKPALAPAATPVKAPSAEKPISTPSDSTGSVTAVVAPQEDFAVEEAKEQIGEEEYNEFFSHQEHLNIVFIGHVGNISFGLKDSNYQMK